MINDTTALNRISKIIDSMDYKTAYIEINTGTQKYTIEKEKPVRVIGFNAGGKQ